VATLASSGDTFESIYFFSDGGSKMSYPGGKSGDGVYQKIINQIPPHDVYIEAFFGDGGVYRHIRPACSSIAIDIDSDVVANWKGAPGLTVICGDAISILPGLVASVSGRVFVYADPPYLGEVRKSKRAIYKNEMMDSDIHSLLLSMLATLPCMVAVSGYYSSLYESMLPAWRSISFNAKTRAGVAREWLWMNYPEPTELHDYRYLGENFREREKIARQKRRWRARLLRMSALQRYALLEAIAESDDAAASSDSAI
jgi:DNA adenine methylase